MCFAHEKWSAEDLRVLGVDANWFRSGILQLQKRTRLGEIRIALFGERAFSEACEQAVSKLLAAESSKPLNH